MDSNRKTGLLINFIIPLFGVSSLLPDLAQINIISKFFFDFDIASLVVDGELAWKDMIIVDIVDIEIFLSVVGEDGVELEEVLLAGWSRTKPS